MYFLLKPIGILLTMFLYCRDFLQTYKIEKCQGFLHFLTIMFVYSFLHFLLYAELFNKRIDIEERLNRKK